MKDIVTDPLLFDLYYQGKSAVEVMEDENGLPVVPALPPVDEKTPTFRNIHIKNIVCTNANRAMYFNGLPEHPIDGIFVENAVISARKGAEIKESKNINLKDIHITTVSGPSLTLENSMDIEIENVSGEIVRN